MSSHDAGAAIAYLPNLSHGHGQSDADGVRLRTEASDLTESLQGLANVPTANVPMRCHVGIVLRQLQGEERDTLARLLDEPRPDGTMVPATEIAGVLRRAGFVANAPSVRRHRRRSSGNTDCCTCE
jgi:hypothetical protein